MGRIKTAYEALGNSKAQRFRRAFLILSLLSLVIMYGFYSKSIHISINRVFGSGSVQTEDRP